jgi:hypothetical protein
MTSGGFLVVIIPTDDGNAHPEDPLDVPLDAIIAMIAINENHRRGRAAVIPVILCASESTMQTLA